MLYHVLQALMSFSPWSSSAGEALASDSERSWGQSSPRGVQSGNQNPGPFLLSPLQTPGQWSSEVCSDEPCLHHPGSSGICLLLSEGRLLLPVKNHDKEIHRPLSTQLPPS